MLRKLVYLLLILIFAGLGFFAGEYFLKLNLVSLPENVPQLKAGIIGFSTLIGIVLGVLAASPIIRGMIWVTMKLERYLHKMPVQDLVMGSVGLIIGLIIANLLGSAFSFLGWLGNVIRILGTILLGYLGLSLAIKKREELSGTPGIFARFSKEKDRVRNMAREDCSSKILDTSVIIDGRIADLCKSGFIEGVLLVPAFVLEELRHIADSSDLLKRNRGRRGLDILNAMRKDPDINIQIYEDVSGLEDAAEVDAKLVKLGQKINSKIMTNDFNLNKVAELHGVGVLNINELANAIKPVVLPGEDMVVQVVKDGKEAGQGVAYLDDGTMIVVDGGKRHVGQTVSVLVTSVLQTSAGRMIFAKLKHSKKESTVNEHLNEVNALG